jgi:hypothetical protein
MNRSLSVGGLSLALSLGACDTSSPEHTTDWYRNNIDVAQSRSDVCDLIARAMQNTDCVNAKEAVALEQLHGVPKIRNLFDDKNN